jgi:hypothetical protein
MITPTVAKSLCCWILKTMYLALDEAGAALAGAVAARATEAVAGPLWPLTVDAEC